MGRTPRLDIILGMGRLPAVANEHSDVRSARIRALLRKGWTTKEIAEKLASGNPRRRRTIERQLRAILSLSEEQVQEIGLSAKGVTYENLEEAMEALARRANKGNVPAIKLLAEISGFHNPRVQHEHSGDIKITITEAPRPQPVEDVIDAEVVDDE